MPEVTVIIPCYNAAAHLSAAVDSIRAQACPVKEILIVDDGSTDGTAELAATLGPGIRVLKQANSGPAAARNAGVRAAATDLITFLDADDFWEQGWLAEALTTFERHPETRMVLGHMHPFHDTEDGLRVHHKGPFFLFVFGCGIYRRQVFDEVGLIDESMRLSEDTDWFFRAWERQVSMIRLDRLAVHYRRHARSMTHELNCKDKGFLNVLKKSLDRRRVSADQTAPELPGLSAGFLHEPAPYAEP